MTTTPQNGQKSRVLLVDDDPEIHDLVAAMLVAENIELLSAFDGDSAIAVAWREKPDLILLDYEMPGANGLEVLGRLREEGTLASTLVIFVTGNDSHKVLTACFRAGAADYIRKPFCAPELRARVRSKLDHKQMQDQLERLAHRDTLTGLCNRASIHELIQAAIDQAGNRHYALLFLDFDRFKLVNDSLGHDVGDQLLRQIAHRLCGALRTNDGVSHAQAPGSNTAARLGGDEFVILLKDLADPLDALAVADRLLTTLAEPYSLAGHQVYSTASIGVVTSAQSHITPAEILRDADTAMYEAKSAGKGRYVLFDAAMHTNAKQRLRMESELRNAIATEELFLTYQPIVSLETGRTTAFEALVRWKHPERGLIMPADFLPVAEETGLIVPMGTWVLDRACQEFSAWRRLLGDRAPDNIHVNLSRKQLLLRDFVETVAETLQTHAMEAGCLHLEVTETEIMQNPKAAAATLEKLRQSGVKIDMDDFGTGHSSLACLQELPIDVLKIDRSFISNMERSRSFAALVHAVTSLGQNLGMSTVAEGIETADQLAMLQSMDCDFGQGYYFAEPLPAAQVRAYLCPVEAVRPSSFSIPALAAAGPLAGIEQVNHRVTVQ